MYHQRTLIYINEAETISRAISIIQQQATERHIFNTQKENNNAKLGLLR
jgi:hypothetical protein